MPDFVPEPVPRARFANPPQSCARDREKTGELLARAEALFTGHCLTVVRADGVHRHLALADPESREWWFDAVTWPGHLYVGGDFEGRTFARATDMLHFVLGKTNPEYWEQKLVTSRDSARRYSPGAAREYVAGAFGEWRDDLLDSADGDSERAAALAAVSETWSALRRDVLDWVGEEQPKSEFRSSASGWALNGFDLGDLWEWDLSEPTWKFVVACAAAHRAAELWHEHAASASNAGASAATQQPSPGAETGRGRERAWRNPGARTAWSRLLGKQQR